MTERNERLDRFLEAGFKLRPGELEPTLLMFLFCLCAVGAFIVGRSIRDTLFLANVSAGELPQMYIWASVVLGAVSFLYGRVADRFRRDRLVVVTAAFMGLTVVGCRLMLGSGRFIYYFLYVWVEVIGSITLMQFWTFANDVYTAREAKRLFGLIGAGGTLANVVAGFSVTALARTVGAENLLYLCAALLFASAGLAIFISRRASARLRTARGRHGWRPPPKPAPAKSVFASPHLRIVGTIIFFTFLTTTFVDYQFKAVAAQHFGLARDAMAAYFGTFFGVTGLVALAIQVGVTGRLLEKVGVVGALLVLPLSMALGSGFLFFVPALWAATMAKASDNVCRYTVNDATMQLLYLPVPAQQRGQAKAFIDGLLKPGTIALAGVLLILYRRHALSVSPLSAAALGAIALWVVALVRLRGEYVRSLRDTLKRRRLDLGGHGQRISEDAAGVLRKALGSPDDREVVNALELADKVTQDLSDLVGPLLEHRSSQVRLLACEYLARVGSLRYANDVFKRFDDPDPSVRASAISAFCAIGRDKSVKSVRPFLAASEPAIKAAAVVGMIRHGGLDGILVAAEALKQLLGHTDPVMREHAARVLGAIGVKNFYQPVLDLLADPDVRVRRAAIQAAGRMKSPELVPALVYRLARRETARDAAEALAEYGAGVEQTVAKVLANPHEDVEIRRNVPRVLGRLGTADAVRILTGHVDEPDEALRRAVCVALARTLRRDPDLPVERRAISEAAVAELERAFKTLAAGEALRLAPDPFFTNDGSRPAPGMLPSPRGTGGANAILASALREKVDRALERIFLLLGVLHPQSELDLVQANLRDPLPQRRANAVEILDNILDKPLKRRLVLLLDDTPRDAKLREAAAIFPMPPLLVDEWLEQLLADENGWVVGCAAHYAGEHRSLGAVPRLLQLVDHPAQFVREASLAALEKIGARPELDDAAKALLRDDFAPVRLRAERIAKPGGERPPLRAVKTGTP